MKSQKGDNKETKETDASTFKTSLFALFHEIAKCYYSSYLGQALTLFIWHIQLLYFFLQFSVLFLTT